MKNIDREHMMSWSHYRETSLEIAQAIFEFADDQEEADEMWLEGAGPIRAAILRRAWQLADPNDDKLFWGEHTETRSK